MSDLNDELEELRAALEGVVARLDDLSFRELREAVARGEQRRPPIERQMTRARNALVRAMGLLIVDAESEEGERE